MVNRWNPRILEKHFAPGIGSFTAASIQDLRGDFPEADFWVSNYFLNTVLRGQFSHPFKQRVHNFLFRSRIAFRLYHEARDRTLEYIGAGEEPRSRLYCDAIAAWESCLLNWAACVRIMNALAPKKVFQAGDDSPSERAYTIQNAVKHWAEGAAIAADSTLPVWLTNDGLVSHNVVLSYDEAAGLMRDMGRVADDLQDPLSSGPRASSEKENHVELEEPPA